MKGQTLIESVLAVSIIGIIISGISVVMVFSLSNSTYAKNQSLATQYAQEGVEVLRSIRNRDYATFATYNNTYCLSKGATALTSSASCLSPNTPNVDTFIRTVQIENTTAPAPGRCALNISRATIVVAWTDSKCATGIYCHNSKLVSCLSTVNPITGP